MTPASVTIVAAMSRNRVIGRGNQLPWHEPEELKQFRKLTMGHTLIMGRRTMQSLVRPLSGRRCIVLTRSSHSFSGFETASSLDQAFMMAGASDLNPMVIGGAEVFIAALPFADTIELTVINREVEGDVMFPILHADAFEWGKAKAAGQLSFQRGTSLTKSKPLFSSTP